MGSKTRKVSHLISKDSSSLENSSKTAELSLTTTSRRNPPFTWSSDSVVECRSSARPSLLRSNNLTPLRTSKPRSKTRKVSHLISKDSSSLENSSKTAELSLTTTSKRNPPFTWSSAFVVVAEKAPVCDRDPEDS